MKSHNPIPKLPTLGAIAASLGVPLHRVQYVVRTRTHIQPAAFVGRLRVYDRTAQELLRIELTAIAARRAKGELGGGL